MIRFKLPVLLILLPALIYISMSLSGCLGSCDLACQNGGVCTSKQCSCPTGYEGTLCETLSRNRLLKSDTTTSTYTTVSGGDNCHVQPYNMNISAGRESYLVTISNFAGSGLSDTNVIVSGLNFYTQDSIINSSVIISSIEGSVSSDGNSLSYSYTSYNRITDASNSCSGTSTKQN